jgi:hypothetical protein
MAQYEAHDHCHKADVGSVQPVPNVQRGPGQCKEHQESRGAPGEPLEKPSHNPAPIAIPMMIPMMIPNRIIFSSLQ